MMFLAILLTAAVNTAPQEAHEYLEDWKEGYFDIHAISTGKGESTFYIFPDGTTMLCDAGDMTGYNWPSTPYPDDSMTPAQWIARYIKHFSKRDTVDYFLLSHFHDDHMGSDFAFRPGQHGYSHSCLSRSSCSFSCNSSLFDCRVLNFNNFFSKIQISHMANNKVPTKNKSRKKGMTKKL